MTIAAAKKHLRSIRDDHMKIQRLMAKRDELRFSLYPKAITYDKDRVQTSPEDVLSERVSALFEIEDKITRVGYDLDVKVVKTRAVIRGIPDERCRALLTLYYTSLTPDGRLYRWEDVAGEIGATLANTIRRIHPKALDYFKDYAD